MGRNKLSDKIRKNGFVVIRINLEKRKEMRKNKLSPSKLFNESLDIKLKSISEFDKPKKIGRIKE